MPRSEAEGDDRRRLVGQVRSMCAATDNRRPATTVLCEVQSRDFDNMAKSTWIHHEVVEASDAVSTANAVGERRGFEASLSIPLAHRIRRLFSGPGRLSNAFIF